MVNINGKEWDALRASDVKRFLSEQDFEESFYFELKDDKVITKKLMEEISAFSNTFGGYIFLGVSDKNQIEGCTHWNEQRIHTTIHDSITPTPVFDIKKFTCDKKKIYVIKVEEGGEPPYITNNGKIYERLSSGSFTIKDSTKLSQIYNKREQLSAKMETKVSIPPLNANVTNVYGYIDIGFVVVPSNTQTAFSIFNKIDMDSIVNKISVKLQSFNLMRVGNSIVYTPGGLTTKEGKLPAHTNNFLEIMPDGSARMRILLINNEENSSINMTNAIALVNLYQDLYANIMGELFPDKVAYAKKYESLTVLKQFHPVVYYEKDVIDGKPELQEKNEKLISRLREHRKVFGKDTVVTDDRIPKTGFYTIDKRNMEIWGEEYTRDAFISELFFSRFVALGLIKDAETM